ncbi:hypothetical protein [Methanoregula sp.]|uniref:hypothetical protein n=1 Tax=Methanoregula sp. TaxID=2052170 RepID=UPI003C7864D3
MTTIISGYAGSALGLTLYAGLHVCDGWQNTPVVFAAVFLLGTGAFSVWVWYFSDG